MSGIAMAAHAAAFRNLQTRARSRWCSVWRCGTIACAFLLGICFAIPARASCQFTTSSFQTGAFNIGTVAVPRDAAIGFVVASRQISYDALVAHQGLDCGVGVQTIMSFAMTGGGSGTYATNIPGIGIRIYVWSSSSYYTTPTTPTLIPNSWTYSYTGGTGSNYGTGYLQVRADLVVTGRVDLSVTNALVYNVGPWMSVRTADGTSTLNTSNLAVTATIAIQTCNVTTSSVSVQLPKAFVSSLSAANSTAGNTAFSLDLNCAAGTNVAVTLTDASNASNRSNILGLAPGSSAKGVALQILNASGPVSFGPDSASPGTQNQWSAGTAAAGVMHIPLSAQYIRTSGTLVPGSVNGNVTFTMSYQ